MVPCERDFRKILDYWPEGAAIGFYESELKEWVEQLDPEKEIASQVGRSSFSEQLLDDYRRGNGGIKDSDKAAAVFKWAVAQIDTDTSRPVYTKISDTLTRKSDGAKIKTGSFNTFLGRRRAKMAGH